MRNLDHPIPQPGDTISVGRGVVKRKKKHLDEMPHMHREGKILFTKFLEKCVFFIRILTHSTEAPEHVFGKIVEGVLNKFLAQNLR